MKLRILNPKIAIVVIVIFFSITFSLRGLLWPKEMEYDSRNCKTVHAEYEVTKTNIEGKSYKLLIADTEGKHAYGLMNVTTKNDICGNDGMIFIFKDFGIQTFWNKSTLVDLDLYWMANNKVVRKDLLQNITDNGMKIYASMLPVNRVVEIIK